MGEIKFKNLLIKLNLSSDSLSALKSYKWKYNKVKLATNKKIKSTVTEYQRTVLKTENAI